MTDPSKETIEKRLALFKEVLIERISLLPTHIEKVESTSLSGYFDKTSRGLIDYILDTLGEQGGTALIQHAMFLYFRDFLRLTDNKTVRTHIPKIDTIPHNMVSALDKFVRRGVYDGFLVRLSRDKDVFITQSKFNSITSNLKVGEEVDYEGIRITMTEHGPVF
jgi:hypothetical protein